MTAGLNTLFSLWRMEAQDDDYVGGASISGTVVYQNIPGRMQGFMPQQVYNAQGLETERTFTIVIAPGTRDIRERDELELTAPYDHFYFGDRFRVIGVLPSDFDTRDPRNYMMLTTSRSIKAHGQQ